MIFAKIAHSNLLVGVPFHKQQNCIFDAYTHCWKNAALVFLSLMAWRQSEKKKKGPKKVPRGAISKRGSPNLSILKPATAQREVILHKLKYYFV